MANGQSWQKRGGFANRIVISAERSFLALVFFLTKNVYLR